MKLIDLLVQELPKHGGWPTGVRYISSHADGSFYRDGGRWVGGFYGLKPSDSWRHGMPSTYTNKVNREQYEAALAASQQPEWDGAGLPPVGTICEALAPVGKGELFSWQRVKVVESGFIEGAEKECLVYNLETTRPSWVDEFRPIRTEAERRREAFIESLMTEWLFLGHDGEQAGALYDAIAAGKIPRVKLEAADE